MTTQHIDRGQGGFLRDGDSVEWDGVSRDAVVSRLVADGGGVIGKIIRVPVRMMDGALPQAAAATSAVSLSDAECRSVVARAEMMHHQKHAHLRDRAPAFTAEQGAAAIRVAASAKVAIADAAAGNQHAAEYARGAAIAARHMMIESLNTPSARGAK